MYKKLEEHLNARQKSQIERKILFSLILLIITLYLSLFVLPLYTYLFDYSKHEYKSPFPNVLITSKIDDQYLPTVDLTLDNLNISFKHSLVPYEQVQTPFDFTTAEAKFILSSESKNDSFFRMYHENEFKFSIKSKEILNDNIKCLEVEVENNFKRVSNGDVEMCLSLKDWSWFGGHESYNEPYWPINNQTFDYVPYVTGFPEIWATVLERYWLASVGLAIFIDDDIPLLVKHKDNQLCFKSSRSTAPYKFTPVYDNDHLVYTVCTGPVKELHLSMIRNFMGYPEKFPDLEMMKLPVFTTWSYCFKDVTQTKVLEFARQIHDNGYRISQIQIDDKWEVFYGDLEFDRIKFPDVSGLVSELHAMNMSVKLWVHPFTNIDSPNFVAGCKKGLWVRDVTGSNPGITQWWNGQCSILDTTNPTSVAYYTGKLNLLKSKYGIDTFKFDGGETGWIPKAFSFQDRHAYPDAYSQNYVKLAIEQGGAIQVRTAHRIQSSPVFFTILDRATDWTIHDGLKSVLTQTLQFGILGYPFVIPDIIGGNGGFDHSNRELFIRWTQLTAFLPMMQFGVPPFSFDQETNVICLKFVRLHEELVFPYISQLPLDGSPIVRPLWWLEPENKEIFDINDQFLVGDDFLVAPVLNEGQVVRKIYLPTGDWYYMDKECDIQGPLWDNFKVELDTIPYFVSKTYALNKLHIPVGNNLCSKKI